MRAPVILVLAMMSPPNDKSVIQLTIEWMDNRQRFTIICSTGTEPVRVRGSR